MLALLLMNANRAISVDRLIDGVWGDDPPTAARHTLQGYISELRKVLEGQLKREGAGYVLAVEPDSFDVSRFEGLTAEGRRLSASDPIGAAERLAEALGLWEGPPYADLAHEAALEDEIRRLGELRLQAVEERIEADLAAGRHMELTGELEALTREHPFRERLRIQQMLALYRSGRQAEALRAYGRVREILAEELGIDPSPELQALEQQILEQDGSLAWTGPGPDPGPKSGHETIRSYELRQVIGQGDFGTVYQAFQPSVGRRVALKVVRPEYANSPVFVRQFEAEAQFIAQLEHPHIVSLYDYWRDPAGAYLVMPYLPGGNLAAALRRGPWHPGPALRLLDQVGAALSHAHRRGVVHRDVKPANVLLDADGNAYLSDFGVATRLTDPIGKPLSSSLGYLPPEELRGEILTAASDIFSLAVLTFELFTGIRPRMPGGLPAIAEVRPDLPTQLTEVLDKATNDQPALRHDRVEDFLREVRQAMGADVIGASIDLVPASEGPVRNPYKGLRAFQETDAADFHGRHGLIDQILQAVSRQRLVCVVGPSGSGKSSVIRAGVIPALRAGAIPGSNAWLITDMFPGSYPFEELETALLRVAVDDPGSIIEELRTEERGLMRVVKRILPTDDTELLIVIDQFEELFSMVDDEETRRLLLDAVSATITDERSRVRVVVTLRADFFDGPLQYPEFGELLREGLVTVSPPNGEALALAISRPARGVGLDLEPGLAGEIVSDIRDQPGGLPLMQFALTELFHRREEKVLTIAAYRDSGGVAAALGRRAEELFTSLSAAGQEAAHQLFLRLVNVDEQADDTRRRVRQTELETIEVDQSALRDVVQQYGSYRLLTFDRDPLTRSPTIEVAHEALIGEWGRLAAWIDEQRENLVLHRRFSASLQEWERSGHSDSFLLSGGRLAQFENWAQTTRLLLMHEERVFLDRSRTGENRRRRRRTSLRWTAAAVLAAFATVAIVQSRDAQREARESTVRQLAGVSTLSLSEDPERAILLAMESVGVSRRAGAAVLPEAVGALNDAVQTSRLELRLADGWGSLAISPDGSLLATDSLQLETGLQASDVVIWDAATGTEIRTLAGSSLVTLEKGIANIVARAISFSPDGGVLAVAHQQPEGANTTEIALWDPVTGEQIGRLEAPGSVVWNPTWSPDGALLAAGSWDGAADTVIVWDVASGTVVASFEPGAVGEIAVDDQGRLVVTHGPAEAVGFYDFATGDELDSLATPGLGATYLAVDLVGGRLAMAGRHEQLQVWDVESRSLLWSRPLSSTRTLAVSPGSEVLALAGDDGRVRLLDLDDGAEVMVLTGHQAGVYDLGFVPDGDRLVSVGNDGETRVWDITPGGSPALGAIEIDSGRPFILEFSPEGDEVGVSTWEGTFERRGAASGQLLASLDGFMSDAVVNPVISPNWDFIAAVTADGESGIWELADPDAPTVLLPSCT
ncbi:MAG TPA: BTAD domain-containing putative transcriptional regulator, partial [Acidimicrobiia bacterium]|nr:BTAD domain-containing putative transcriptional regulator [Acidimicrobiia bacterium]